MSQILTHPNKKQSGGEKLIELNSDKSLETISRCISWIEKGSGSFRIIRLWLQSYRKTSEIPFNFIISSGFIEIINKYIVQERYLGKSITNFLVCCCSIFHPGLPRITTFNYKIFIPLIEYCFSSDDSSYVFYGSILLSQILVIDPEIVKIIKTSNLCNVLASFLSRQDPKTLIIVSQTLMIISLEHANVVLEILYSVAESANLDLAAIALKAIISIMEINKVMVFFFVSNNIYQVLISRLKLADSSKYAIVVCCVVNIIKRIVLSNQTCDQNVLCIIELLSEKLSLFSDNKSVILNILDVFVLCVNVGGLMTFFTTEKLIQTILEIDSSSSYDVSLSCSNLFIVLLSKSTIDDKFISSILDIFEKVIDNSDEDMMFRLLDTLSFLVNSRGLKETILNHPVKDQIESILNNTLVSEKVSYLCFNILT